MHNTFSQTVRAYTKCQSPFPRTLHVWRVSDSLSSRILIGGGVTAIFFLISSDMASILATLVRGSRIYSSSATCCFSCAMYHYNPCFNEVERVGVGAGEGDGGRFEFHLVRLWTESCPLCVSNNTHRIHSIFTHLIKLLQKNHVRSVSSTILAGSISYLHILSSYFRRCVACKDFFKIKKVGVLANSLNLLLWLCLVLTWGPMWINSMGNHGAAGVSSGHRRSSCSSFIYHPLT